ncbi:AbrB/MazE/SpoVT family DNA-binding domain-containing protein [Salinicoccus sp. ID82-1]|uniref:AbrB/MazE/SpoVT family DNA-binding domain-containing protein n=1 Tax=Salinicoccus sp. ID82-1 TaxID=2820269 RepID=UPI001F1A2871|nr:AbrB/MazE/SpoVT family DNA-binding domain-containing protein [Salinicoccus sp. ID82-1]MCG1010916.1 AbrB/MazE/SpoVT family DNA-binding domain-containing protein [Salinicoccus sp. ID82-1]
MKSTGIVRKVDELGRVVVPIELRRTLDIEIRDSLEVYTEGDAIILKKYAPELTCAVTGKVSKDNMVLADGNLVLSTEGARILLEQIEAEHKK